MQLLARKILQVYYLDAQGVSTGQAFLWNGSVVYPERSPTFADGADSKPGTINRAHRIVYWKLDGTSPLLVLDVLPGSSSVKFQSDSLEVDARIFTVLQESSELPGSDDPVKWSTRVRTAGGGIEYAQLAIWEKDLKPGSTGSDLLADFLAHDRAWAISPDTSQPGQRVQVSRKAAGIPHHFTNGMKLRYLDAGSSLRLELPAFKTGNCQSGIHLNDWQVATAHFVSAGELYADKADGNERDYFVVVFRLRSIDRSSCSVGSPNSFRLFDQREAAFRNKRDLPVAWELIHRPGVSIRADNSLVSTSPLAQESVLHVFGVPAQNVLETWGSWAKPYHDGIRRVTGGESVSFLPRFPETGPDSQWVMTYRLTAYAETMAGPAVFGGLTSPNPSMVFQPVSLHLWKPDSRGGKIPPASLPGVVDVSGSQLTDVTIPATPTAAPDVTDTFADLSKPERVYGIALNYKGAASVRKGNESVVRMGALDLVTGSDAQKWTDENWIILHDKGDSRVHVDLLFALSDVLPGGQDDPVGEEYVPDRSATPGANPCAADLIFKPDPQQAEDRAVERMFRRKRPLVIHPDASSESGPYALRVNEDVAPHQNRTITLQVRTQKAASSAQPNLCIETGGRRAIILDRSPFLVAQVLYQPFEKAPLDGSSTIATWTNNNPPQGASWMLQFNRKPYCLVMPPQALGEEMIKDLRGGTPETAPSAALEFRFSPPARIAVDPSKQLTSTYEAPWNLRRILGTPQDPLPGPMVSHLQYELLYGLTCDAEQPAFRLAELFARIGQIPGRRDAAPRWTATAAQVAAYREARKGWAEVYARYLSRIAVLEPWAGIINTPGTTLSLKQGLTCIFRPADMANPITPEPGKLRGGAQWGFESKNIYDQVMTAPKSTAATLESLAVSSLGGWGRQSAEFLGGISKVYSDTQMGRTSSYKLERLGRIAAWWTLAKHVIVYERSVTPSRQFWKKQPNYFGWPVLRKVREYVEILEDARPYPDNTSFASTDEAAAAKRARGPIQSIQLKKGMQFNVDGSWGGDVGTAGWKIPLWNPGAWPPDVYPKPDIGVATFVAGDSAGTGLPPVIDNPENLFFFTSTSETGDPHSWAPVAGVDFVNAPPPVTPADFENTSLRQTVSAPPMVAPTYGPCTFRLQRAAIAANVVADRAAKPLGAVFDSITVVRAIAAARPSDLPPAAHTVAAVQSEAAKLYAGLLRALPDVSDLKAPGVPDLNAQIWKDIQRVATPLIANAQQQVRDATATVQRLEQTLKDNAARMEKELADRLTADLKKVTDDVLAEYRTGAQQLAGAAAFNIAAARALVEQEQRNLEEKLLLLTSRPGSLLAFLAKYVDAVLAIRETVKTAAADFENALRDWQARKDGLINKLDADIRTAIGLARSLQTLRRPAEWIPDPYAWVRDKLGPILADIDAERQTLIDHLHQIDPSNTAAVRTEIARFKLTPFYVALTLGDLPPGLATARARLKGAAQAFEGALADWQAQKQALINQLNQEFQAVVAAVQAGQLPPPGVPDPYAWVRGTLASIQTQIDNERQQLIANLQNIAPAQADQARAEINRIQSAVFYVALMQGELPAGLAALVKEALGSAGDLTLDQIRARLHQVEAWWDARRADWAARCNAVRDGISQAADLLKSIDTIKDHLADLAGKRLDDLIASVKADTDRVVGVFRKELGLVEGKLAQALTDLNTMITNATQTEIDKLRQEIEKRRDEFGRQAELYLDKTFHSLVPDTSVFQVPNATLRLIRAFGSPPQVPSLTFDRDKVAYTFKEIGLPVDMTPVLSRVAQAGEAFDKLKTIGATLPTISVLDQLLQKPLAGFGLSNILPNLAGLDLRHMFPGLTLPFDIKDDDIRITHDLDPQRKRAVVRADVKFQIAKTCTLFTIGPVAVDIHQAGFEAAISLDAGLDGQVRRTAVGTISGAWQLSVGGVPFVNLNNTKLRFDDAGGISFSVSPKDVQLPGVLALVSDLLNSFTGKDSGLSFGMLPDGFQSVISLPVPDIQGLTSGFSNLRLGATFAIQYGNDFTMSVGFTLARKEAPFSLTVFILGGGGYMDARATYTPATKKIGCSVDVAMTVSASLAISLAVISGGVYVYFGASARYATDGQGLTFGVMFLIRGEVSILGIVSAAITLLLEATYGSGLLTGRGRLSIKIKICWCFTLEVSEEVSYTLGTPGNQPRSELGVPERRVLLAQVERPVEAGLSATAVGGPWAGDDAPFAEEEPVPAAPDVFQQHATEYVGMFI